MLDATFTISTDRQDPSRAVVHLIGELDMAARDDVSAVLLGLVDVDAPTSIVVDLDQVAFIDSEAIGAILDGYTAATTAGITLRLRNAHGVVYRVFDLLGLSPLFERTAPGVNTDNVVDAFPPALAEPE